MALLTFPTSPADGDLYPLAPVPGQNQYRWEAATNTWRLVGTATAVVPGTYGSAENIPQFTVDITGAITAASNIPIGQYYVKTGSPGAFNSYIWPAADGAVGSFLQTDGSGNLSWSNTPFINYWQLIGGNTLAPIANGYELALTDPAGNTTFFADNSGVVDISAPGGAASSFIQFKPDNTLSTISVGSGTTGTAEPLSIRGEVVYLAAYGNNFANSPSVVTLTQAQLSSEVNISTDGAIIVNANTANSFATPSTRGSAGQYLVSNGDGTTSWNSSGFVNYWVRNALTPSLQPAFPGDYVEVVDATTIPRVILDPAGKAKVVTGLQSLTMDSNYAAGVTQLTSQTGAVPGPADLNISGNKVVLQPWGSLYTNPATTFTVGNPGNIELKAVIGGINTTLFTVNDEGDLSTGRYIDNLAPALFVEGLNGNVTVGGRLTVNAGVPIPGSGNSYTFPGNRGVANYALFTNADGTTRWDNVNVVSGYWSEVAGGAYLYPTAAGQNVVLRNSGSATSITFDADGWINAIGGDATNPTYSFVGTSTGFYGGSTDQINIGVNGVKVGKFDNNFFYVYEDINFIGKSTNPGADAVFENTNTELLFTASTSTAVPKDIVFENWQNNQVAKLSQTGNFTVNYGNAAIGSTTITTDPNFITLSIGDNAAGKAGRLKLYSTYNGGDGFELTQSTSNGDVSFSVNSGSGAGLVLAASGGVAVNGDLNVNGDTTITGGELIVAAPTPPASATAAGTTGTIAWDGNYVYICVATNTWKRAPLTTW